MNITSLTATGLSRAVLHCGVEVIRKIGSATSGVRLRRHTVIVAGQHGTEVGPVLALQSRAVDDHGLHRIDFGAITIVRCANPYGFAVGSRFDLHGNDPNRGWTATDIADSTTVQSQVWDAITSATPDGCDDLLVLDLHSSGVAGNLARKIVCIDDRGRETAEQLVESLVATDRLVDLDPRDATWDVLDQTQTITTPVADKLREHPIGTLASWANANGGTGLTVEFAEHTHRPLPAGYDFEVGVNPSEGWRTMTENEKTHGVGTLLRWVIARHRF